MAELQISTLKPCVISELKPPLQIHKITCPAGLEKARAFFARSSVFTIDVETNVVDNFIYRRIRTIQFGDRNEQYIIDLLPFAQSAGVSLENSQGGYKPHDCYTPIIDALRPVLESRSHLKVGHNLQFDYEALKFCLGLRMWNLYDTMLAEKVLHAGEWEFNRAGIWALDDCVARYCGMQISKAEQTSFDLESELLENQWTYCALDCRLPIAVKSAQFNELTKSNLMYACQIEFDAIPAFGDMYLNGLLIDQNKWLGLVEKVEADHRWIINKLDEFFIPVVGTKGVPNVDLVELESLWRNTKDDKDLRAEYRKQYMASKKAVRLAQKNLDKCEGEAAINYGSNAQVLAVLRRMGFGKQKLPNTDDRALKKAAENPSWDVAKAKKEDPELKKIGIIDGLRLFRETSKFLSTYGRDWLRTYDEDGHINPHTGRIHSRIKQLGASTGRTSSTDPNIQNLPRGSEWRGCFIAPPGYSCITLDYNGCELRILTEYSRERVWMDAFLKGWDVHSVGAEIVFGDEWKNAAEEGCAYYKDHQKCKCKIHKELRDAVKSINFGIAYGMEAKKLSEAIGKSEEYAVGLLKKYKAAFPTLVKYLEASGTSAAQKLEARTLSQRRRMFLKPTWQLATRLAVEDFKRKGKGLPETRHINQKFKALYASIEREGKNTPIQGSNADMAKIAMGCGFGNDGKPFMWHKLETEFGAQLVNFIHDEFVVYVPNDRAKECFDWVAECMSRGGAELVKSIPMTTEGHIAERWMK